MIRAHDSEGRLSLEAVGSHPHGKQLAELVKLNCTFALLSYKMELEEPTGMACISQSRNKGHKVALPEHEWTALATLNGLCIPDNGDKSQLLANVG